MELYKKVHWTSKFLATWPVGFFFKSSQLSKDLGLSVIEQMLATNYFGDGTKFKEKALEKT